MSDVRISEMRAALIAMLSTAASMGIDVGLLGHSAVDELLDQQATNTASHMLPVLCIS